MTRLSTNINKVALLRNSRGGNRPDVLQVAQDCIRFGAEGITVHPRPDARHIRYTDVRALQGVVQAVELNVEGYPSEDFLALVSEVKPAQVTLVPDPPGVLTSSAGWDCRAHGAFLRPIVQRLQAAGCRVSLFLEADPAQVDAAHATGTHRIELYTGPYAADFPHDPARAVAPYVAAAERAGAIGLGVNAGHDLDLANLAYFVQQVPQVLEVSIGHALISDALYLGLAATHAAYLKALGR